MCLWTRKPSHHKKIPLWLLHFIWQVHDFEARLNRPIQLRLLVEQLLDRWYVGQYIAGEIMFIDIKKLASMTLCILENCCSQMLVVVGNGCPTALFVHEPILDPAVRERNITEISIRSLGRCGAQYPVWNTPA